MSDATYKVTEVVGTSTESIQKAVRNGIARASKTLRNLDWFEVTEIRGHIVDGDVGHFQVFPQLSPSILLRTLWQRAHAQKP